MGQEATRLDLLSVLSPSIQLTSRFPKMPEWGQTRSGSLRIGLRADGLDETMMSLHEGFAVGVLATYRQDIIDQFIVDWFWRREIHWLGAIDAFPAFDYKVCELSSGDIYAFRKDTDTSGTKMSSPPAADVGYIALSTLQLFDVSTREQIVKLLRSRCEVLILDLRFGQANRLPKLPSVFDVCIAEDVQDIADLEILGRNVVVKAQPPIEAFGIEDQCQNKRPLNSIVLPLSPAYLVQTLEAKGLVRKP